MLTFAQDEERTMNSETLGERRKRRLNKDLASRVNDQPQPENQQHDSPIAIPNGLWVATYGEETKDSGYFYGKIFRSENGRFEQAFYGAGHQIDSMCVHKEDVFYAVFLDGKTEIHHTEFLDDEELEGLVAYGNQRRVYSMCSDGERIHYTGDLEDPPENFKRFEHDDNAENLHMFDGELWWSHKNIIFKYPRTVERAIRQGPIKSICVHQRQQIVAAVNLIFGVGLNIPRKSAVTNLCDHEGELYHAEAGKLYHTKTSRLVHDFENYITAMCSLPEK